MYFYYNNQGEVKMISEKRTECSLNELKKTVTAEEKERISLNHPMKVVDENISFELPARVKEEVNEAVEKLREKKLRGEKITSEDLAEFIINNL